MSSPTKKRTTRNSIKTTVAGTGGIDEVSEEF